MTRKQYDRLVKRGKTAPLMREFVEHAGHRLIEKIGPQKSLSFTLSFEPSYVWVTPTSPTFPQFGVFGFSPDPYLTPEPDPWYVRLGRAIKDSYRARKEV